MMVHKHKTKRKRMTIFLGPIDEITIMVDDAAPIIAGPKQRESGRRMLIRSSATDKWRAAM
jgi:hypothetical protein